MKTRFMGLISLFVVLAAFGCSRHASRNRANFNPPAYAAPAPDPQYVDNGYNDLGYQPGAYGWFDGYALGPDYYPIDDYGYHIPGYGPTPLRKIKHRVPGRIRVYHHNFYGHRAVFYYGNRSRYRSNGQYHPAPKVYHAPSRRYSNSSAFRSGGSFRPSRSSGGFGSSRSGGSFSSSRSSRR